MTVPTEDDDAKTVRLAEIGKLTKGEIAELLGAASISSRDGG